MLYLAEPFGGWEWQEMQLIVGVSIAPLIWPVCVPDSAPDPWQPSQLTSVVCALLFLVIAGGALWHEPQVTVLTFQMGLGLAS